MFMFDEVRFPEDISYGAVGGPEFSTDIALSSNGIEKRNINWQKSRGKYNVSYGIKSKEQLDIVREFFYARRGKAIGFRFKDWFDYSVTNEILSDRTQLSKTYSSGGRLYVRHITKPVENSVKIYVDSKLYEGEYSVDYATGKISYHIVPEGVVFAAFEFDVPVRFDTDHLAASIEDYGLYSWKDITLIEIK